MTEAETAMFDAIRTILECLLGFGYPPDTLAALLAHQRDGHRDAGRTDAAALLDILCDDVLDPERRRLRQAIRQSGSQEGTA